MTDQLEIVPAPPKLTPRQQTALHYIQSRGTEGATSSEIGEALGGHPAYHRSNGAAVARALKTKGLVRQRKGGIYIDADAQPTEKPTVSGVPYNQFPEGF